MARIEILNPLRRSAGSGSRPESYSRSGQGLHYTQNGVMQVKHHRHHRRHHRRNPLGFDKASLMFAGEAIIGGVGALALPAMILPAQNSGWMGYGLNVLASIALKFVGDSVASKAFGDALFAGGLVGTGLRVVKDQLPSIPLGAYWQSYFAVPTVSDQFGRVLSSPYPQPALPAVAAGGKGMSGASRFNARF